MERYCKDKSERIHISEMEFRDLKSQYQVLKRDIDAAVEKVMTNANFISGREVAELESQLAEYVGVKHCVTCANGTDALQLALMAWGIGKDDAVFLPDFTFFSTAEVVPWVGATPIFVDIDKETFNLSPDALEKAVLRTQQEGKLTPRVIIAVDLFGLPAEYPELRKIADKYHMLLLEDGAQGFGGRIGEKRACSFGDISTTSFFPAKPLGCYGDGGAIFTDCDEWAALLRSFRVHGKGSGKYDNVRLGMNSRLDTLQAAVLQVKLRHFDPFELESVNQAAAWYGKYLGETIRKPVVKKGFLSSWAQYTVLLKNTEERDRMQETLKQKGIPAMVYYPKGMHEQKALERYFEEHISGQLPVTEEVCGRCLSLPMHPYLQEEEVKFVCACVNETLQY